MKPKRVVFVCVGNMCRSQMAEGLARYMTGGALQVESAGTHPAGRVSREALMSMSELGIDIAAQWSKGVDEVDLNGADAVVSMAPTPAASLVSTGYGGVLRDWDVGDPVGLPVEIFRIVRRDLTARVRALLKEMEIRTFPVPDKDEPDEESNRGE